MGNDSKKNVAEMIKFYIYPPPKKWWKVRKYIFKFWFAHRVKVRFFCVRARLNFEEFAKIVG